MSAVTASAVYSQLLNPWVRLYLFYYEGSFCSSKSSIIQRGDFYIKKSGRSLNTPFSPALLTLFSQIGTWIPSLELTIGLLHHGPGAINSPSLLWYKPVDRRMACAESQQAYQHQAHRWGASSTDSSQEGLPPVGRG